MKIDLHSHSTCSDGTFSPTELLALANKAGIDMFALTDHDSIAGLMAAKQAADNHGIRLIHGVEISCHHSIQGGYGKNQYKSKSIHVVALNFDDVITMQHKLQALQDSRENRGRQIVLKMADILAQQDEFSHISDDVLWQAVLAKASGNPKAVGRAHIAQVLHELGVVKTIQLAFDKYLADNKPAYVAIDSLSINEAVELIHACGGVAVLAHPTRYGLSATRVRRLIADFAQCGGDGCELPPPSEPISTRAMIDRCIAEHALKVSVGSDFHGATMPWRRLGETSTPKAEQVGIWEQFG
ncbi:MAG: PHP domain-containing protein [Moraxella sp.]|nr:PHP domain-containing protein [Moraxella sp.]